MFCPICKKILSRETDSAYNSYKYECISYIFTSAHSFLYLKDETISKVSWHVSLMTHNISLSSESIKNISVYRDYLVPQTVLILKNFFELPQSLDGFIQLSKRIKSLAIIE